MPDAGPFKPFKPYTEQDRSLFFARDRELADLVDRLSQDRPSALLYGEPGVGKSSLVRAALIPAVKTRGVGCGYIDASHLDEGQLPSPGSSGALLVIDDLGAALDEGPRQDKLLSLLKRAGAIQRLKILFVLDDDDLWRLDGLERLIGHVAPLAARVRLDRLDEARVGDAIERTVLGGGAYFEAGLSHEMAADLAKEGPVSPSMVQVVAAGAVMMHFNSLRAYRASGGADVIAWRFFDRACGRAGGPAAVRALAEIAALDRRRVVKRDQIAAASGVGDGQAEKILTALTDDGVLKRRDGGWTLASEWARAPIRMFTGEAFGRGVSAKLLLRRKLEGGGLLSPVAVREVRRYAGTLAPDEEQVVRKSVRVTRAAIAAAVAVPAALLVLAYLNYGHAYYFDAGPEPGSPVVARLGRGGALAGLPHFPRFGTVVADSGFARAALKNGVPSGAGPRSGPGDDRWLRRLTDSLEQLPRAAVALVLDGDLKPLGSAWQDPELRPALLDTLAAAGRGGPEEQLLLKNAAADSAEDVAAARAVLAASALERRVPGAGVEVLAMAVKDPSPSVRALALAEIQRLPDEQSAPLLASALAQTSDPVVRRTALDAIGAQVQRTPPAAAALGRAMLGPARAEAAQSLGKLLDGNGPSADAAADALAKVALDPKAPEDARIEALKLLRRRAATPAGVEAITGSPKLMAAAMPLVVRAKPDEAQAKVAESMKGPVPLRVAAAAAIGLLPKTPDTPKQLKVLQYDANAEVHAEAVRSLPVLGREALPLLVKEAKGAGPEVERAAVETMGAQSAKLGASSAVSALEAAVKGARPTTRKAAIEALGRLAVDKPGLAAGALGRLVRDKVPEVRADAAAALGDVLAHGGKEAISALKSVAKDPDAETRKRAAAALGRAKAGLAPSAAKALASFAGDAESSVRSETATALGALGAAARDSIGLVAALAGDKDAGVRAAAHKAAQTISAGTTIVSGELDKALLASFAGASPADRVEIAETAGLAGATSTLRAALADSDAAVRRAAAAHAGALGASALGDADAAVRVAAVRGLVGAKAAGALAQAARSPDLDVRVAALEALGEVAAADPAGAQSSRAALESALNDASERVRGAAVRGMAALGASASSRLETALGDPARDVRDAAVVTLGAAWADKPAAELSKALADETNADRRWAAALALARQGETQPAAVKTLDDTGKIGTPAAKLTARVARAFVGRAGELASFLHLLRTGS